MAIQESDKTNNTAPEKTRLKEMLLTKFFLLNAAIIMLVITIPYTVTGIFIGPKLGYSNFRNKKINTRNGNTRYGFSTITVTLG